jgi:hypothetical protein
VAFQAEDRPEQGIHRCRQIIILPAFAAADP